jgi:colanic acid biosynthesis glycosyl transferase WcaI
MNILYISQYFPPEVGATQTRAYEMAAGLTRAGHRVTMITEVPNHPQGIIDPDFRGKLFNRSLINNMEVIRVWVLTSARKNFIRRLFFYLSFMLMAVIGGLVIARKKYDVIYATSPPLTVGGAALVLRFLRNLPVVFEIRDVWPDSAIALGELKNQYAISLANKLEYSCYNKATKIVVVHREMKVHLIDKGVKDSKISIITNGSNTTLFRFHFRDRERLRRELNFDGKFVVIYAGIFGIAQNLKIVLQAALKLKQLDTTVQFLLIGDGPERAALIEQIERLALDNILYLPAKPREHIPLYLSAADVAWVPVVNIKLIGLMPSKMFDALACERPVILGAVGPACRILEEHRAGVVISPEDAAGLAGAIIRLKKDRLLCREMGQRGRKLVVENYSREKQSEQLCRLLESLHRNEKR